MATATKPTAVTVAFDIDTLMYDLKQIRHEAAGKMTPDQFAELEQFVRLTLAKANEIRGWIGKPATSGRARGF